MSNKNPYLLEKADSTYSAAASISNITLRDLFVVAMLAGQGYSDKTPKEMYEFADKVLEARNGKEI